MDAPQRFGPVYRRGLSGVNGPFVGRIAGSPVQLRPKAYGPVGLGEGLKVAEGDGEGLAEGLGDDVPDGLGDGLGVGRGMVCQSGRVAEEDPAISDVLPVPSAFITQMSSWPERLEVNAIVVPSGDQLG